MDVPDDLELFAQMCFLRHFEERTDALYRQGLIHGPVHLGLGQEAIAAGAASVLRRDDYSLGTYRGHAHALARGAPPGAVLAELLGKTGGICGGKGGSMHITSVEHVTYSAASSLAFGRVARRAGLSLVRRDVLAARCTGSGRRWARHRPTPRSRTRPTAAVPQ